jgi:hypothetical protein
MAQPTTFLFGKGLFELGTNADPIVYTVPCGFREGTISLDHDLNDETIMDCANPDAPAWKLTTVEALSWGLEFSGLLAKEALPLYEAAFLGGVSVPVRHRLIGAGVGSGTPDKLYSGLAHVKFSLKAEKGRRWNVAITVTGDGALTIASVAALP